MLQYTGKGIKLNDLNQVALTGNLVRDPELKYLQSGTAIVNFTIGVNRKYKSGEEYKKEVSFIDVTSIGKMAEIIAEHGSKGRKALISGRITQRSWQGKDDKRHSKTEVFADSVQFFDKAPVADSGVPDEVADGSCPF